MILICMDFVANWNTPKAIANAMGASEILVEKYINRGNGELLWN